ncbi:hypothetical protein ABK040_012860 [Willaertia magna]
MQVSLGDESAWNVVNPDDLTLLNTLIHIEDESNNQSPINGKPILFQKQQTNKPFELNIELPYNFEWTTIDVFSTAKTIELYTSKQREYSQTNRFTNKIGDGPTTQYHTECSSSKHTISKPCHSTFLLKFLSLDYPEKSSRQTKLLITMIILRGKKVSQQKEESKSFENKMSGLMMDPKMLIGMMGRMNNNEGKMMSSLISTLLPMTNVIDQVKEESVILNSVPVLSSSSNDKGEIERKEKIIEKKEQKVIQNNDLIFSSKDELKDFINECIDERMKMWEEKLMNKLLMITSQSSSPLLSLFTRNLNKEESNVEKKNEELVKDNKENEKEVNQVSSSSLNPEITDNSNAIIEDKTNRIIDDNSNDIKEENIDVD